MIDVNGPGQQPAAEPHIAGLLAGAFNSFRAEISAHSLPGLRPSHYRVMALIPPEGLRLSLLAQRAAITKAGIGQFMKHLEREGYVRITPDPSDSRAKIATLTPAGEAAVELSLRIIAETEQKWAAALGAKRYQELRRALNEVSLLTPRNDP
ncbi:MarR family winged helix-turn-helix transcriptional regulator [Arthrobacter sp. UYCu723]